jgi:predicted polyphosphate/ATP-dependent NAD kinase
VVLRGKNERDISKLLGRNTRVQIVDEIYQGLTVGRGNRLSNETVAA